MPTNRLNEKQEKFCHEVLMGKTQRQAYYSAYPSSLKWKPANVDSKASQLINSDKVMARLVELRSDAEKRNEITRKDLLDQLKNIGFADVKISSIKATDKIKAIEVMSKILGYDKGENESATGGVTIVNNIPRSSPPD